MADRIKMPDLAPTQAAMLDFLKVYTVEHGYQPSARDFMKHFGWSSPNSVMYHLRALERKGYIRLTGKARAIEIVGGLFKCAGAT